MPLYASMLLALKKMEDEGADTTSNRRSLQINSSVGPNIIPEEANDQSSQFAEWEPISDVDWEPVSDVDSREFALVKSNVEYTSVVLLGTHLETDHVIEFKLEPFELYQARTLLFSARMRAKGPIALEMMTYKYYGIDKRQSNPRVVSQFQVTSSWQMFLVSLRFSKSNQLNLGEGCYLGIRLGLPKGFSGGLDIGESTVFASKL